MTNKKYFLLATIVFIMAGTLHAASIIFGWKLTLNGYVIPSWMSVVAVAVTATLAYVGYKASR